MSNQDNGCTLGYLDNKPSFPQDWGLSSPAGVGPDFPGVGCWHSQTILMNNWHSKSTLPGTRQPESSPTNKAAFSS